MNDMKRQIHYFEENTLNLESNLMDAQKNIRQLMISKETLQNNNLKLSDA